MPKTRRDLLQAIAEKFGGCMAVQISQLAGRMPAPDTYLDRAVTDEEYVEETEKLEGDRRYVFLPTVRWTLLDHLDDLEPGKKA